MCDVIAVLSICVNIVHVLVDICILLSRTVMWVSLFVVYLTAIHACPSINLSLSCIHAPDLVVKFPLMPIGTFLGTDYRSFHHEFLICLYTLAHPQASIYSKSLRCQQEATSTRRPSIQLSSNLPGSVSPIQDITFLTDLLGSQQTDLSTSMFITSNSFKAMNISTFVITNPMFIQKILFKQSKLPLHM